MDRQRLAEEIRKTIADFISAHGLELVDLIYRYEGRDLYLRILVDYPEGGITIGECAGLNSSISRILDEEDIIGSRYILEVSSPGLDRPLRTKNDFLRCLNKEAIFFLRQSVNARLELSGRISEVRDDAVGIDIEGSLVWVNFVDISKAKQLF